MKELGWSLLLVLPVLNRGTRPLAYLVALKFALIYALYVPIPAAPAIIDVMFAPLVAIMVRASGQRWALMFGALYSLMLLAHGVHWSLWANGVYIGEIYYAFMLGLFTAVIMTFYGERGIVEFIRSVSWPSLSFGRSGSLVGDWQTESPDRREEGQSDGRLADVRERSGLHLSTEEAR